MKHLNFYLLGIVLASLSLFTACRGPEGPVGPAGPQGQAGPGTQTAYLFRVTPPSSSGYYEANCPAVVADNATGTYSTVNCYLHFDGYDDAVLVPYTDTESDTTTTTYFCSFETGEVTLVWINSGTTVPAAFDLVVTVVN